MDDLSQSGIDVAVCGWTGRPENPLAVDGEGVSTDAALRALARLVDSQAEPRTLLAIQLEPYEGRSARSVADDVRLLNREVLSPRNSLRLDGRPVYYVYDSYRTSAAEWATVLRPEGAESVRGTDADAVFFGLCLEAGCVAELAAGGFDGLYTYFASDGFTYGATVAGWPRLVADARAAGLLVSLSVGPGYDDTRIRPWNGATVKPRDNGGGPGSYYRSMFAAAAAAAPDYISVTSYNEFGEGTNIEASVTRPCIGEPVANLPCDHIGFEPPSLYMDITREQSAAFRSQQQDDMAQRGEL